MADRQQQYRGKKEQLPILLIGELGFCTDTKELYIGSASGNVLVGSGEFATKIETLLSMYNRIEESVLQIEEGMTSFDEILESLSSDINTMATDVSKKLTANQAESVATLADNAEIAAAVGCINSLIGSLKTAGIMK